MGQNEPNIDELLNSFLDGELDPRHQTEVQRLIKHDEKVARRLLELQKCRNLVSSLPYNEAPQELLRNIKASLSLSQTETEQELIAPPAVEPVSFSVRPQREGARYLFLRRIAAAAAMFALVAVLAAVIYSIIAPVPVVNKSVAVVEPQPSEPKPPKVEVAAVVKPAEFSARLELKTASPSEVVAFINKAIEFNIPVDQRSEAASDILKESRVLTCSRQNLKALMDELGTVWNKIDSAALLVNTDSPEGQIVIDAVTPAQVVEIAKQDDSLAQIKTAKFFAVMNNIAERSPGREVMVAIDNSTPNSITIPKPVLTSNEKPVIKAASDTEAGQKVLLTIVVTDGR